MNTQNRAGRYTFEDFGQTIRISAPYRRYRLLIFGSCLSLTFISAILILSLIQTFSPAVLNFPTLPPFSSVALLMLLPSILVLIEFLWLTVGKEVAEISDTQIVLRHSIFGLAISKRFRANTIGGVFTSRLKDDWPIYMEREIRFLNFKKGAVAFNYGKTMFGGPKTFRFGSMLVFEDANKIVQLIHQRFPQYKVAAKTKAG